MSVLVRSASLSDRRGMAEVIGITPRALGEMMDDMSAFSAWHLAEDGAGDVVGVQHISPLDEGIAEIATFLADHPARLASGTRLFEASAPVARQLGYRFIDALMDPGNDAARIYYQSRGFREAGQVGAKRRMRFDLD